MARVLINIYQGRPAWEHLSGRSMFGAAGQTERALRLRQWCKGFGSDLRLTDSGREIAANLTVTPVVKP